jgi:hypothetical protein
MNQRWLLAAASILVGCASTERGAAPRDVSTPRCTATADDGPDARALAASAVRVAGVELDQVGVAGATLVFTLEGPAAAAARTLARVDATLVSGGRPLQRGAAEPRSAVAPGKPLAATYRLRVDFADLLQRDRTLRPGLVLTCQARLAVLLEGADGRRAHPAVAVVDVPVPTAPRLSPIDFRVAASAATSVRGVLRCRLENGNAFPLDLERLSFGVRVGAEDVGSGAVDGGRSLQPGEFVTLELPFAFDPRNTPGAAAALRGENAPFAVDGTLQAPSPYGVLVFAVGDRAQVPAAAPGR